MTREDFCNLTINELCDIAAENMCNSTAKLAAMAVEDSATERKLILRAMEAINRCADNKDMKTVLVLCELCKKVAGDRFEAWLEIDA